MPPQPSPPHALPTQVGVQPLGVVHWPAWVQLRPVGHVPQLPPQPSDPHVLPLQLGTHTDVVAHVPSKRQLPPEAHAPQVPPQPSPPQIRAEPSSLVQSGSHAAGTTQLPS